MTGVPDPFDPLPGLPRGVLPDHDGRGIANVAASLAQALDAEAPGLRPPVDAAALPPTLLEDVDQVVLLVVDGLGWNAYREADLEALPALAEAGAAAPLTSVLPSTTATALPSLHLGAAPADHGLVAPMVDLPEADCVANLLRWTTADGTADLRDRGVAPGDLVEAPALPEVLADDGVASRALTREDYVGSPLSEVLYRGADVDGLAGLDDLAKALPEAARRVETPGLVMAYWDGLDATGHLHGPGTDAWEAELARIDEAVGSLAGDLPPGTLLLVTSDHGFVPTPPPLVLSLDDHPDLTDRLDGPATGEVRWRFAASREPDGARAYVEDRLGHAVDVLDQPTLLEAGAYGAADPPERIRERYGDLVLAPKGERSVAVRYGEDPPPRLAGHHGGPTPREALVPLVAARPGR